MRRYALKEKYHLPDFVEVKITKSRGGAFTAALIQYPGCITYANSLSELFENINDAILTYFEVPKKEAVNANFVYIPKINPNNNVASRKFVPASPQFVYA